MKVAIYARVSSEAQTKDGTIQSQLERLREYAQEQQLEIVAECLDDGYSGSNLNRPGLDQVRDLAASRMIAGVLILSPDRLTRAQIDQIILMEEFKKRAIQVIYTNHHFGNSAEDKLLLQIQGSISEYERSQILDRTRRGKKHAVNRGQFLGGNAPYGYKYIHKTSAAPGHWEINLPEAKIVKLIFAWYVKEGLAGPAIVKRLTAEGYAPRTGRKWWTGTIYDMLRNETYTGTVYMYKNQSVEPKKHPKLDHYRKRRKSSKAPRPREEQIALSVTPIIDLELWDKAQQLLEKNKTRSPRNNKKNQYLLRGLAVCGLCGCMAPGSVSNKNTYYSCGAKRNKNFTTKPHDERITVRHKQLDGQIWQGLVNLLDDPANIQAQLEKRMQHTTTQPQTDTTSLDRLDRALEKLIIQESRLIDAYREAVIDLDELKTQKAKLAQRMAVLEDQKRVAKQHTAGVEQTEITPDMLGDVSARFQRVMANADFKTKKQIADLLVNRVILYPDKARVEGNIPITENDALILANDRSPLSMQVNFL